MKYINKFKCWWYGHRWKETSQFSGGACFKCKTCDERYESFCGCPSYKSTDDYWFFKKGKIIYD